MHFVAKNVLYLQIDKFNGKRYSIEPVEYILVFRKSKCVQKHLTRFIQPQKTGGILDTALMSEVIGISCE